MQAQMMSYEHNRPQPKRFIA